MADKLRVALVGCGPIAERHLLSWTRLPEVELVALCDRHAEHFPPLVSKYGLRSTYTDFSKLLAEVEIDAVDIATRPYSHRELVSQAARAGKHILCQKPFASTLEEALEMIRVCDQRGVRLMVCENWRWFVWFQAIKRLLEAGSIGEIKYFRLVSRSGFTLARGKLPAPIVTDPQVYLKDMERLLIYEFAIHLIDVLRFLFGDADSVYARLGRMSPDVSGEDFALIVLDYGAMHGCLDASWCSRNAPGQAKSESLIIEGSAGSIILETTGRVRIVTECGEREPPAYDWQGETKLRSHFRLHEHFVRRLRDNKPFQTEARDNLKTLEITLKSYESAAGNKVIKLQKDGLLC